MPVTKESGGRLNAFANEPEISVINSESSIYGKSQIYAIIVVLGLISIIGIYFFIK